MGLRPAHRICSRQPSACVETDDEQQRWRQSGSACHDQPNEDCMLMLNQSTVYRSQSRGMSPCRRAFCACRWTWLSAGMITNTPSPQFRNLSAGPGGAAYPAIPARIIWLAYYWRYQQADIVSPVYPVFLFMLCLTAFMTLVSSVAGYGSLMTYPQHQPKL